MERNILYFDKAPDAYVEVLESVKPEGFNILYWDKMSDAEREEMLPKVHYTINTTFRVTADIIEKATSLKMIQRTGVGINNVDVECADRLGIPVISAMGTGNKTDPERLETTDIYKTSVCPLARVMRRELRARGVKSLKVVYSKEEPKKGLGRTPASCAFVPSAAGLIIAGNVVRDIIG